MMRKIFMMLMYCLIITFISCDKDNEIKLAGSDYIIFGHYYGECIDRCVVAFKLEENKLFKDEDTDYILLLTAKGSYKGNYIQLSQ